MIYDQKEELPVPPLNFDAAGKLIITSSLTSSKKDFDFLIGANKIHHKVLKVRLRQSQDWREFDGESFFTGHLAGIANTEVYKLRDSENRPLEGMALRFFDPETKLWSIYWTQSNTGILGQPPEVGSFKNNIGFFFSQGIYNDQESITVFRWDARDPKKPVWSQAISMDKGKTWEWNWFMYYTR